MLQLISHRSLREALRVVILRSGGTVEPEAELVELVVMKPVAANKSLRFRKANLGARPDLQASSQESRTAWQKRFVYAAVARRSGPPLTLPEGVRLYTFIFLTFSFSLIAKRLGNLAVIIIVATNLLHRKVRRIDS